MPDGVKTRLAELRAQMAKQRLDGMVIGREDMFQGEEVPPGDERLAYISGFSGSAGYAFVTADAAALFSDGRYSLQNAGTNRSGRLALLYIAARWAR